MLFKVYLQPSAFRWMLIYSFSSSNITSGFQLICIHFSS